MASDVSEKERELILGINQPKKTTFSSFSSFAKWYFNFDPFDPWNYILLVISFFLFWFSYMNFVVW